MGRPAARTRNQFIDAAIEQVAADGLENLSLRSLASRLGVSHSAVYTHFGEKRALIDAMLHQVIGEIRDGETLADATPREKLCDIASRCRAAMSRHPRLIPAMLNMPASEAATHTISRPVLHELERAGYTGAELAYAFCAVENYIIAATVFDHGGAPDHLTLRRQRHAAISHPALSRHSSDKKMVTFNENAYLYGFEKLLDGLGITATSAPKPAKKRNTHS